MYVLDKRYENKVYPSKPQFYYIKVGFKGVYIARTCFPDETSNITTPYKRKPRFCIQGPVVQKFVSLDVIVK